MKGSFKDLGTRFISAIIMAAICIVPIYFGGLWFLGLAVLIGARIVQEWVRMSDLGASVLAYAVSGFGVIAALIAAYFGYWPMAWIIVAATTLLAALERMKRGGPLWAGFGVLYIAVPSLAMLWVRGSGSGFEAAGFQKFLFVLLIVIGADVGAYLGGSLMKGPKIAPKLSPKKTWSGFCSGLVLGSIVGMAGAHVIGFPVMAGLWLAVPVVIASVIGDFLESGLKRRLNVKDTGGVIPGHGGVLDRIDSLMFAMTIFAGACLINADIWPMG